MTRILGFGLCDGATALALHHAAAGLDGLILANPWTVEPAGDLPPPAAIRRRYAARLLDPAAWKRLLTGGIDYRAALRGLASAARPACRGAARQRDGGRAWRRAARAAGDRAGDRRRDRDRASMPNGAGRASPALRERAEVTRIETSSHSFAAGDEPTGSPPPLSRR